MPEITLDQAIDTIARALVATRPTSLDDGWEDFPLIGEYDWEKVQERAHKIVEGPATDEVDAATAFLAAHVETWEATHA